MFLMNKFLKIFQQKSVYYFVSFEHSDLPQPLLFSQPDEMKCRNICSEDKGLLTINWIDSIETRPYVICKQASPCEWNKVDKIKTKFL